MNTADQSSATRPYSASDSDGRDATGRWIGLDAALRKAREDLARGRRPRFDVTVRRNADGSYSVSVLDVPEGVVSVTGRKGIDRAARSRIALLLELGEDDFDVMIDRTKGQRRTERGLGR